MSIRTVLVLMLLVTAAQATADGVQAHPHGTFAFAIAVDLPGTAEAMYDALTGDISAWWDHSFSGHPVRLEIEPYPGGRFIEIIDEAGDGVVHATVTAAQRGKLLRMEGPLGLAGHAIHMVTTYTLWPAEAGSRLEVSVRGAGEVHEAWPAIVERTWRHFIEDRFVDHVTAGKHEGD
jgi:hypothetical protein